MNKLLLQVGILLCGIVSLDLAAASLARFELSLDATHIHRLNIRPREWARARVQIDDSPITDIGLHLKGAGTFQRLDGKPSFTLKINFFERERRWREWRKIHLNNSLQDPTYMCHYIASCAAQRFDVPCAESAHAEVALNRRELGLFTLVEGVTKDFADSRFGNHDGVIFEGEYQDVTGVLDIDFSGTRGNTNSIQLLIDAVYEKDLKNRHWQVGALLDLERFARFLAFEAMLGHWDGYATRYANYRIYHDPRSGKFHFILHGMDNLFSNPAESVFKEMKGLVAKAVTEIPSERIRFVRNVENIATNGIWDELPRLIDERRDLLLPVLQRVGQDEGYVLAVDSLKQRIAERRQSVVKELAALPASAWTNGELITFRPGFAINRITVDRESVGQSSPTRHEPDHHTVALRVIDLEFPQSALTATHLESTNWLPVTIREGTNFWTQVRARLKGRSRRRVLTNSPCLTVKVESSSQSFHGFTKFHLENAATDPSYLNQFLAADIMRRSGLQAPRIEYAVVRINGKPQGFYIVVEGATEEWLQKNFGDASGSLYEGERADIDGRLDHDGGPTIAHGVKDLVDACKAATNSVSRLASALDIDRFARFMAVEALIQHTDGYCFNTNNYRLYRRSQDGKFAFLFHGFDQVFLIPELSLRHPVRGLAAKALLASPDGRILFANAVEHVIKTGFDLSALSRSCETAQLAVKEGLSLIDPTLVELQAAAATNLRDRLRRRVDVAQRELRVFRQRNGIAAQGARTTQTR